MAQQRALRPRIQDLEVEVPVILDRPPKAERKTPERAPDHRVEHPAGTQPREALGLAPPAEVVDHAHVGEVERLLPERADLETEVGVVEPDRRPLVVVAADRERVVAPVHHAGAHPGVDLGDLALESAAASLT